MNKKALELFELYRQAIDREFYDEESARAANERCQVIMSNLGRLGFIILVQSEVTTSDITLPGGEAGKSATINFVLILVPLPPANQTPIAQGTATSKIFPPGMSKQEAPFSIELSPEDKKFLQSHDIKPNGK